MNEIKAKSDPEVSKDKHRSLTNKKILCILLGIVLVVFLLPPTVSRALKGKTIDVADVEPWHRAYTISPLVRSPCYRYNSALGQARQIEFIEELIGPSPEEKRLIAENIIKLWQTDRGCGEANDYLHSVLNEGMNISEQK